MKRRRTARRIQRGGTSFHLPARVRPNMSPRLYIKKLKGINMSVKILTVLSWGRGRGRKNGLRKHKKSYFFFILTVAGRMEEMMEGNRDRVM